MVSDGLSMINADFSNTSFRVSRARIGERNFLGNLIVFPPNTRTGENCLLSTKVLVPVGGPVRENTGLLGSPCFEIPRSVDRDGRFDHFKSPAELPARLTAKLRHNTVSLVLFLLVRWIEVLGLSLLFGVDGDVHPRFGIAGVAASLVLGLLFSVGFFVFVERASTGFRSLRKQYCSIYDHYFWWHERFWKLNVGPLIGLFNGTPFKNLVWRGLGVRIGHRVFDDGCGMVEKTLVTIGDDCLLNLRSSLQCHSLEDGVFKCDRITLRSGCTVGPNALVHYGAVVGDRAVIDADSFLMKGQQVAAGAHWRGNPAMEIRRPAARKPESPITA